MVLRAHIADSTLRSWDLICSLVPKSCNWMTSWINLTVHLVLRYRFYLLGGFLSEHFFLFLLLAWFILIDSWDYLLIALIILLHKHISTLRFALQSAIVNVVIARCLVHELFHAWLIFITVKYLSLRILRILLHYRENLFVIVQVAIQVLLQIPRTCKHIIICL
jgi:hypothetical protein